MAYDRYEAEDEDGAEYRGAYGEATVCPLEAYAAETDRLHVLMEIASKGLHSGLTSGGASVLAEKRLAEMLSKHQGFVDG